MTTFEKGTVPGQARDVYEIACLVAGRGRVADVALVELIETGRVRVQRTGTLTLVEDVAHHPAERRVLDLLASRHHPLDAAGLRQLAVRTGETPEERALRDRGLLSDSPLGRLLARFDHDLEVTHAGVAARAGRPRRVVTTGPSAQLVAVGGLSALPDRDLRAALTSWPAPAVRARRRSSWSGSDSGGWATWLGSSCGGGSGGGCGGGSGCGGGCGGGGGGGCGGGG